MNHKVKWIWLNFTEKEMSCHHCGKQDMDVVFMNKLQQLRQLYNKPLIISSAYRCPEYNKQVSSSGLTGPHTTGKAVDIIISGKAAYTLLNLIVELGFTGIGFNQKGLVNKRFIHIDTIEDELIRPNLWSY